MLNCFTHWCRNCKMHFLSGVIRTLFSRLQPRSGPTGWGGVVEPLRAREGEAPEQRVAGARGLPRSIAQPRRGRSCGGLLPDSPLIGHGGLRENPKSSDGKIGGQKPRRKGMATETMLPRPNSALGRRIEAYLPLNEVYTMECITYSTRTTLLRW